MKKLLLSLTFTVISLCLSSDAFGMRRTTQQLMKTAPRRLETRLFSNSILTHSMHGVKPHNNSDNSLLSHKELVKNEFNKFKEAYHTFCSTHFIEFYDCIADSDPLYQTVFSLFTQVALQCKTYSIDDSKNALEEELKNKQSPTATK